LGKKKSPKAGFTGREKFAGPTSVKKGSSPEKMGPGGREKNKKKKVWGGKGGMRMLLKFFGQEVGEGKDKGEVVFQRRGIERKSNCGA